MAPPDSGVISMRFWRTPRGSKCCWCSWVVSAMVSGCFIDPSGIASVWTVTDGVVLDGSCSFVELVISTGAARIVAQSKDMTRKARAAVW